jgi:hypothetical protein
MVEVQVGEGAGPVKVRMDGKRRLNVVESGTPGVQRGKVTASPPTRSRHARPTAADEKRYPKASIVLDSLSGYLAATLASLVLLPLSQRKIHLQLPRGTPILGQSALLDSFAGGRATLGESALRFASTALVPPPVSTLVAYLGSIPLRGAVVRAQSGAFATARTCLPKLTSMRGLTAVWRAHVLRDVPFLFFETYALTSMVLGRAHVNRRAAEQAAPASAASAASAGSGRNSDAFQSRQDRAQTQPAEGQERQQRVVTGRRGGINMGDAVLAGTIAGVLTVPLDLLHTRMLVSGRPSALRTAKAAFRLARQRGPLHCLQARGGALLYVAECMAKPVARVAIYSACRALLVSSWLNWKMRDEVVERVTVE